MSSGSNKTVLLIMGSTRMGRICPTITQWVARIGRECTDLTFEVIDLADWRLPLDDEPAIPALGPYAQAHTHAWSDKVRDAAAVVFVTPQYNWGYPAALKNAIDHLYREWHDKPAVIVTYGGHGGTRCARQLRQVAAAVKLRVVSAAPAIMLPDAAIREGAAFGSDEDLQAYRSQLERALAALAAQLNGCEPLLARTRRRWKRLVATVR
jgi:NAD(P)H-dependent FMN reductase